MQRPRDLELLTRFITCAIGLVGVACGADTSPTDAREEAPAAAGGQAGGNRSVTATTGVGGDDGADDGTMGIAPTDLGTDDITAYFALEGDQVVVVPNGTYKAREIAKHRAATDGRYGGWLILVAETPGGVIIDHSPQGTGLGNGIREYADCI